MTTDYHAPQRSKPTACVGCGKPVIFEPYFGMWGHKDLSNCEVANHPPKTPGRRFA
jgi:hypothetical protein